MALIVNSIKDFLKNDNRGKLSKIREYCLERIKTALSKCGNDEQKFERDIFGASCISETVKAIVFGGMDRSDIIVVAGR